MKQIAVVATEKEYAEFLMGNISKYMHKYAKFKAYSLKEIDGIENLKEDFVLLSAFNIFQKVKQKISMNSEIIVLSLSLNKKQMESLKNIPKGTKALLVNFDNRTCMHTITSMYDAGFRDVELFPYFGEGEYDKSIKLAITPNEAHLVPEEIENVINVGESSVDMNSLYNIADKLGVYDQFAASEAVEARKEYYYINSSMDKLLGERESQTEKLNTLIKLMNEGIIIIDVLGKIYLTNEKAKELMADRTKILLGFNIEEVLPEIDINTEKETLIKSDSINLMATAVEIKSGDEILGHIITLSDFEEVEEKQHGMRSKLSETSHTAKYNFDDILGDSKIMRNTLENAKQIASSDAPVMIIGESGTGKEMFAQSIHNASSRHKYNFVAVNCAAIPDNLLESEMFGYEEGSFTGAKKGGKMGYFELAHKGTIFLDEIGEMPLLLQSKLLRVLEEKKVMRIGSNKNINVDVRIIAATNKNLYDMVDKGKFREDLYYRLNVLPLTIEPLKNRREDILPIFYACTQNMRSNIKLSTEAENELTHYSWRGNVRELRNIVEFLVSKQKEFIDVEDLPPLKDRKNNELHSEEKIDNTTIVDKFILNEGRELNLYGAVLDELISSLEKGQRYGRQMLLERINEKGEFYSEGEIRKALSKLSSYGFVRSAKGRGGSVITSDGIKLMKKITTFKESGILG